MYVYVFDSLMVVWATGQYPWQLKVFKLGNTSL